MKRVLIGCTKKEAEVTFELWKHKSFKTYNRVKKQSCELCSSNRDLTLHHIDGDKRNNRPRNLQTLCNECHNDIHRNEFKVIYVDSVKSDWEFCIKYLNATRELKDEIQSTFDKWSYNQQKYGKF